MAQATGHRHIWLSADRHNAQTVAPRLQIRLKDLIDFCASIHSRRLQLNPDKTEIMWFGLTAYWKLLDYLIRQSHHISALSMLQSVTQAAIDLHWLPADARV